MILNPKNLQYKYVRWLWKFRSTFISLNTVDIVSRCFILIETATDYDIELEHVIDKEYKMAKKFDWNFADLTVTKESIGAIEEFAEAHEHDLSMMYDIMIKDLLKATLTYSEKQDAWIFTLTVLEGSNIGDEISMVTWGDNPIEVQWISFYKHVVLNQRKKWVPLSESKNWG